MIFAIIFWLQHLDMQHCRVSQKVFRKCNNIGSCDFQTHLIHIERERERETQSRDRINERRKGSMN